MRKPGRQENGERRQGVIANRRNGAGKIAGFLSSQLPHQMFFGSPAGQKDLECVCLEIPILSFPDGLRFQRTGSAKGTANFCSVLCGKLVG